MHDDSLAAQLNDSEQGIVYYRVSPRPCPTLAMISIFATGHGWSVFALEAQAMSSLVLVMTFRNCNAADATCVSVWQYFVCHTIGHLLIAPS